MEKNLVKEVIELLRDKHSILIADEEDLLKEDLGMDSLERVEFAIRLEKKFGIVFSDEETEKFKEMTVSDVVKMIDSKLYGG
uniref:Carrier domain-containing protein n=1 Tax=uncultured Alphaproteobacteria bacterium TaxID=91750 RepID=A0A6G8F2W2_9PROT|nr:hypothetical protein PlAlph_5320 [uncultured Alphaproteobacteria bacterium]